MKNIINFVDPTGLNNLNTSRSSNIQQVAKWKIEELLNSTSLIFISVPEILLVTKQQLLCSKLSAVINHMF